MLEKFSFSGFTPTHALVSASSTVLGWVLQVFPDDYIAEGELTKNEQDYECTLTVASSLGILQSMGRGETPYLAMKVSIERLLFGVNLLFFQDKASRDQSSQHGERSSSKAA